MKQEILDKYGLTEAEFYKKYPTEAAFKKAHPEEFSTLEKFAKGGDLESKKAKGKLTKEQRKKVENAITEIHENMLTGKPTDQYDDFYYGENKLPHEIAKLLVVNARTPYGIENDPQTYATNINKLMDSDVVPFTTKEVPLPTENWKNLRSNDMYWKGDPAKKFERLNYSTLYPIKMARASEMMPEGGFAKGGKLPEGILKARLESHMSPEEVNDYIANYASGGMIKRADGSYSKRGLWDNIRANKGSGKKPTKEMLKQEAKIRAQEKAMGGYMYAEGGKLPTEILRARLESHMSSDEAQDYINEYGKGGYTVTRSNDRKGKTHKVTGPDGTVKYFGDSKLGQHPKDPKRKKAFYARHATNLKNNPYFRAFARATWAEGGYIDPSYTVEDFAEGGRFWKDAAVAAYGSGEGLANTLTFGASKNLLDKGYKGLQKLGNSTEDEIREQDATRGFARTAGAITGGILNPAATGSAVAEGTAGLGQGISETWGEDSEGARIAGQLLPAAGSLAGMFMGDVGSGSTQAAKFAESGFGQAMGKASKYGQAYNMFSPFMNMATMQAKGGYMPSIAGALEGFTYAYGGELADDTVPEFNRRGRINYVGGYTHENGGTMVSENAEAEKDEEIVENEDGSKFVLSNRLYPKTYSIGGKIVKNKSKKTFAELGRKLKNEFKLRMDKRGIISDPYDLAEFKRRSMDLEDANQEEIARSKAKEAFEMAKGGWIKKATESIKRRGTEGVCTGSKFGGPTCPPGSKRYNLAKTFRKMAKARKHAEGGFVGELYDMGGEIQRFDPGGPMGPPTETDFFSNVGSSTDQGLFNTYLQGLGAESFGEGSSGGGNGTNWMNIAGAAAPLVLGTLGNVFGTRAANKPIKSEIERYKKEGWAPVDYGTISLSEYTPTMLDPTQSLLAIDRENRIGRRNAEMAGAGNLATMMANKQTADAISSAQKSARVLEADNINRERQAEANRINTQIRNEQAKLRKNLEIEGMTDTQKAKGQYYSNLFDLESALGANRRSGWLGATGSGADSAGNVYSNKQMLDAMQAIFTNPETQKMLKSYRLGLGK